jgi:hypothetical protein
MQRTIHVIASEAKQSMLAFGGEMDGVASPAMTVREPRQ